MLSEFKVRVLENHQIYSDIKEKLNLVYDSILEAIINVNNNKVTIICLKNVIMNKEYHISHLLLIYDET